MKTLKIILTIIFTTLLFTACKKDKNDPTEVKAENMLDYYFVIERNNTLIVLYFYKEGTNIIGAMHTRSAEYIRNPGLSNGKLSFDVHGDGTVIYTFDLKKDGAGSISLESYSRIEEGANNDNVHAQLYKTSDIHQFERWVFTQVDVNNSYLYFAPAQANGEGKWAWNTSEGTVTQNPGLDYRKIAPRIWKSSHQNHLGVNVSSWKNDNNPTMLVTRDGLSEIAIFDPYSYF